MRYTFSSRWLLGVMIVVYLLSLSCRKTNDNVKTLNLESSTYGVTSTDIPTTLVSRIEFDRINTSGTWSVGDEVVYQLKLFDGDKVEAMWYLTVRVDSTVETEGLYHGRTTVLEDGHKQIMLFSSQTLPGHLTVHNDTGKLDTSETKILKSYLQAGLIASCDANDPAEMAKGSLALVSFFQMIQQNSVLQPMLYQVMNPPLWSMMTEGINVGIYADFQKKSRCQIVLGNNQCQGYRFPVDLKLNDKTVLIGEMTVIEPICPFHVCGGIISLEGGNPRTSKSRFSLKLISAKRGEDSRSIDLVNKQEFNAYLMAYFGPEEKLFYAVSDDARHWETLNGGKPVFDSGARLRDPFLNRVKDKFHLVHTKGWDHPTIFHWESTDLIHWEGGPIDVVPPLGKRAWAPEYFYVESEGLFYVHWASLYNGHNTIHYVTTKDWSDITPDRSTVWFDLGIHDIDLTIVEHEGIYYGFHKPGDVGDRMGNRLSTVTSLDPKKDSFGRDGHGRVVFDGQLKPTEGPEVIRLIGQDKWYVYGDPFKHPLQAWETKDFIHFDPIEFITPAGAKHGSMIPITQAELDTLKKQYPNP